MVLATTCYKLMLKFKIGFKFLIILIASKRFGIDPGRRGFVLHAIGPILKRQERVYAVRACVLLLS